MMGITGYGGGRGEERRITAEELVGNGGGDGGEVVCELD
jgi:hypothetical protein